MRERPGAEPDEEKEKALFDEIFQMSFRVPASGYDVGNYVRGKLEQMGIPADGGEELDFYTALIRRSVGVDPKSMDRLFNSFLLLKNMADKELFEDRVQRLMLFALLCMQTRYQTAYDIINTDHTADISQAECAVFARVLEFSSITSK